MKRWKCLIAVFTAAALFLPSFVFIPSASAAITNGTSRLYFTTGALRAYASGACKSAASFPMIVQVGLWLKNDQGKWVNMVDTRKEFDKQPNGTLKEVPANSPRTVYSPRRGTYKGRQWRATLLCWQYYKATKETSKRWHITARGQQDKTA